MGALADQRRVSGLPLTSTIDPAAPELRHRYHARGAALELLACRRDEVILSGPAGTGKSRACLEKMHLVALRNPEFRGLMVRKTMKSMSHTGLVTFRSKVAKESIAAGHCRWFGGSVDRPAAYMYQSGAEICVGGMDDPAKIMSSEYDIVFVQEATELTLTDWESITTRLRNAGVSYQQVIADCNPGTEFHWLKRRALSGQLLMLESRHEDNPVYFDLLPDGSYQMTEAGRAYIEGKLDKLSGPRKQRLRYGKWTAAEGQIYEEWDDAVHHVARFTPPRDWPRYWVIDFGFANPFVLQRWAEDPDGRLWLYAETYRTGALVEDHAAAVLREVTRAVGDPVRTETPGEALAAGRRAWKEPPPQVVICDHDAEGRATFERHTGLVTTAADKTVTEGIQGVSARLRRNDVTRRPGLYIMRDARTHPPDAKLVDLVKPTCTAEEFPGYVWAPKPRATVSEKPEPEEPLKVDDHGCDCVRYLVRWKDAGATYKLRTLSR